MNQPRNYNRQPHREDQEQPRNRNRNYEQEQDIWHPNRIDYRNDERDNFRGSYRLDNTRRPQDQYDQLNQENFGNDYSYGHRGNSRNGADRGRHQSDYGTGATYGASRNAGSMGSYGGAQGFVSASNGYHNERWASGHYDNHLKPQRQLYGAYRDSNSYAPGERQNYDGSQRYGSQGADNTRGWRNSEEREPSRYNRFSSREDDSRYEIYDTSEGQYNRGNYNNSSQGTIMDDLNLRSHQEFAPRERYGSRQRARNRQGSGYDQDMYSGTSDIGYGHTATPFENEVYPRNRYYDPLSGDAWNPGSER